MEKEILIDNENLECFKEEDSEELEEISDDETEEEINVTSMDKNTNLHFSAALGIKDNVLQDIESPDMKIDAENFMGWTPLMMAVRNGRIDVAKILLEKGADVTKKNKLGVNIFIMSIANGNKEMIEMILRHMLRGGISRNRIQENFSPISFAILFKRTNILNWIIDQGFNLNASTWNTNVSPLMFAAVTSNDQIVHMLESRGANKNHKNYMGLNYREMMLWRNKGLHHLKKLLIKQESKEVTKTIIPIFVTQESSDVEAQGDISQNQSSQPRNIDSGISSPEVIYRVPNNTPCVPPATLKITSPLKDKPSSNVQSKPTNIEVKFPVEQSTSTFQYPTKLLVNKVHHQDQHQNFLNPQVSSSNIHQKYTYQAPSNMHYPNYLTVVNPPYGVPTVGGSVTPLTPIMLLPQYENFITNISDVPQNSPMSFISSPQNINQNAVTSPQFFFSSQFPQNMNHIALQNSSNLNGFHNNSLLYQFFSPSRHMYTFTSP